MEDCKTKYPVMMVHGTGFRDRKILGYWGRIPKTLEENGAQIYYGNQDSWGTIENNAAVVLENLREVVNETGCEKVNIIAHSKGGIEARYMVSALEGAGMVASITTVATPHHGSKTMDKLKKLPDALFKIAAVFADFWFKILGDEKPDFKTTCHQFTTDYMQDFNDRIKDVQGIYYQSFATVMKSPFSDIIMFWPNTISGITEGENDGLVTPQSATWTNFKGVWRGKTMRGISHADSVDIRRCKISKKVSGEGVSDICDCYTDIVKELKQKGL